MQSRMQASENFDAEVFVTTRLDRELALMCQEYAIKAITKCSQLYNFDLTEALQNLNLTNTKIERESRKEKEGKVDKKIVEKLPKLSFPVPFNGQHNIHNCSALRLNHGLYTQCCNLLPKKESSSFCKTCTTSANKNNDKIHEYGTIQQRMEQSIESYADPLGRTPTHYLKVLKKLKISIETVIAETSSYNITINPFHLTPPQEEHNKKIGNPKSPKGRPKKEEKIIQILDDNNNIDLFKNLVNNRDDYYDDDNADTESNHSTNTTIMLTLELPQNDESINNTNIDTTDVEIMSTETSNVAEDTLPLLPPIPILNKKQREKAEKEALRQKEKAEKAEKESLRQAEKAEKEASRQKEKSEKEDKKKVSKKTKKTKKEEEVPVIEEEEEEEVVPEQEVVVPDVVVEEVVPDVVVVDEDEAEEDEDEAEEEEDCKKIKFNGKFYIRSEKSNIVYNFDEYVKTGDQIVVGKWNITTKLIEFKNEDDEEEEEEYD